MITRSCPQVALVQVKPLPGATRYFIVKPSSGSLSALEISKQHTDNWSFPPATERRLLSAVGGGHKVVVIFSVASSKAFQVTIVHHALKTGNWKCQYDLCVSGLCRLYRPGVS